MTSPAEQVAPPLPVLMLCAPEHADVLAGELGRYTRDYEIRCVATAEEASAVLREVAAAGGRVPLLVTESALPDAHVYAAFAQWRSIVPTARRIVTAHWSRFRSMPKACEKAWPRESTTPTC